MKSTHHDSGRVLKAPENFLDQQAIKTVVAEAKSGRRGFIRQAFAAAAAGVAAPMAIAQGNPVPPEGGDTNFGKKSFFYNSRTRCPSHIHHIFLI